MRYGAGVKSFVLAAGRARAGPYVVLRSYKAEEILLFVRHQYSVKAVRIGRHGCFDGHHGQEPENRIDHAQTREAHLILQPRRAPQHGPSRVVYLKLTREHAQSRWSYGQPRVPSSPPPTSRSTRPSAHWILSTLPYIHTTIHPSMRCPVLWTPAPLPSEPN